MNTVIVTLSATDPDSENNGKVMYRFSNRVSDKILDLFYIDEHSGELSVMGTIDYETDQAFSIQVVAYDLGEPAKSSTVSVDITVEDANDNSPIINLNQPPGGTTLAESSKIGTFIAHVEIVDKDSGNNGIVLCNVLDKAFRLEVISGSNYKIVLNESLDHDTRHQHNVTILCLDMGDIPRQTVANFILHVADVNDNAPEFTESIYSVAITENNQIGATIVRVTAQDNDSGLNGQVSYELRSESNGSFILDSGTGLITANMSFDREVHGDHILFHVLALDQGAPVRTSTGTIVLNIYDINDNDPVFDTSPIDLYVFENSIVGSKVGTISVFDPDKGANGTFKLIFPDDEVITEYFTFDQSGLITTRKVLDRESNAMYQFVVSAVDMGGRTSSAEVTIFVEDLNDNRPEVIYPNEYDHTVEVPVTHAGDSMVLQVEARDYDSGVNAELYFTIRTDNSSGAFTIDHLTGEMFLNKSLEDCIGDVYTFDIDVSDGGIPSLNTSIILNLHIVPAMFHASALSSGLSVNLGIVLGIVLLTVVLATTMIIIILKTCWNDKHKKGPKGKTTNIILESNKVDLKFDSLATRTNITNELKETAKETAKEKDICSELQIDDFQHGYYDSLNETGYLTNSSTTSGCDRLFIEQVKSTSTDDMCSDNSVEMCTHDSGRGGSELDLNITVESPAYSAGYHSLDKFHMFKHGDHHSAVTDRYNSGDVYHTFNDRDPPDTGRTDKTSLTSQYVAVFTSNEKKMAARKELSKLYKIQKRVMFSEDLETVDYNDIFKSLHTLNSTERLNTYYSHPKLNTCTAISEDITNSSELSDTRTEIIESDGWMV